MSNEQRVRGEVSYFVHDAKTYRIRAGVRIRKIEELSGLSRSTITRIEGDSGTSDVSAYAYLNALRQVAPDYPHPAPTTRPKNARVKVAQIPRT